MGGFINYRMGSYLYLFDKKEAFLSIHAGDVTVSFRTSHAITPVFFSDQRHEERVIIIVEVLKMVLSTQ